MNKENIKQLLKSLGQDTYQDIEIIDFVGYAKSYLTWENIKDLITWENKSVIDIGCNYGYFAFKAEQMGAEALGLDMSLKVINIANTIKSLINSSTEFRVWDEEQPIPDADITLCLNVFHHLKNKDYFLSRLKSKEIIFEIDKEDYPKIASYFRIIRCKDSHRPSFHTGNVPNRLVILALNIKKKLRAYPKKIFLAGSSVVGKSIFALNYSSQHNVPYFNFDECWKSMEGDKKWSEVTKEQLNQFLSKFPKRFISDNIPHTSLFLDYDKENTGIIYLCCTDKETYIKRCLDTYGQDVTKGNNFAGIYFHFLDLFKNEGFKILDYYDTFTDEYITEEEMLEKMAWLRNESGEL